MNQLSWERELSYILASRLRLLIAFHNFRFLTQTVDSHQFSVRVSLLDFRFIFLLSSCDLKLEEFSINERWTKKGNQEEIILNSVEVGKCMQKWTEKAKNHRSSFKLCGPPSACQFSSLHIKISIVFPDIESFKCTHRIDSGYRGAREASYRPDQRC